MEVLHNVFHTVIYYRFDLIKVCAYSLKRNRLFKYTVINAYVEWNCHHHVMSLFH